MNPRALTVVVAPFVVAGLLAGCGLPFDNAEQAVSIELNFRPFDHGWEPGFANFAPDQEEGMELEAGHEPLPEGLEDSGSGLFIAGTNHSDDLFMFWKGRRGGLRPDARYRIEFRVEFASEAPSGCAGIGGAPGESVFVKVGATAQEPEPVLAEGNDDFWVMNIDKGNQAQEGTDARNLGHVGNRASGCTEPVWELKTLEEHGVFETRAGPDGAVWLFVGTDSGFEGRTRLFYTRFRARFERI